MSVTMNVEQELYIIPCGEGFSCLGFDVCMRWATALAKELGIPSPAEALRGTMEAYEAYRGIVNVAHDKHRLTGWKSRTQLTPELEGFEHCHVRVTHTWTEWEKDAITEEFWVGKSTGFIPCHLQLDRASDTGGPAVALGKILKVEKIKQKKK